jgi:signal transduction histidine kinase
MKDEQLEQDKEKYWDINAGGNGMRVINYPYPPDAVPTHVIQVGISKGPVILLLKKWMVSVLISIPFILVVTWFVGRLLASRILRPLNRITATAGKISYENLNLRVEPKLNYLEMNRLIGTFNDMISRLEKSFEHIENFSTHVAHELKTPLTIIRGEAELAFVGAKSIQHKNSMSIIIDEIDTVLRTIEDLLFLSKTNYQPDSFNFQEIDLGKLLNETGEKFELITNEKNIRFQFSRPKEMIFIRADKLHLRRLFFNLLDNALKFTPERGTMKIEILIAEKDVHICISDSGIGISQDDLARVFDQFFHGDNKQKGTGLGLSIAQAIAKAHNGKITVESQLSVGTTFTVILPFIRVFKPALV